MAGVTCLGCDDDVLCCQAGAKEGEESLDAVGDTEGVDLELDEGVFVSKCVEERFSLLDLRHLCIPRRRAHPCWHCDSIRGYSERGRCKRRRKTHYWSKPLNTLPASILATLWMRMSREPPVTESLISFAVRRLNEKKNVRNNPCALKISPISPTLEMSMSDQ